MLFDVNQAKILRPICKIVSISFLLKSTRRNIFYEILSIFKNEHIRLYYDRSYTKTYQTLHCAQSCADDFPGGLVMIIMDCSFFEFTRPAFEYLSPWSISNNVRFQLILLSLLSIPPHIPGTTFPNPVGKCPHLHNRFWCDSPLFHTFSLPSSLTLSHSLRFFSLCLGQTQGSRVTHSPAQTLAQHHQRECECVRVRVRHAESSIPKLV